MPFVISITQHSSEVQSEITPSQQPWTCCIDWNLRPFRQQGFPAAGQYPGETDSLLQLLQSFKYLNAIDSPGDRVAGQSYDKCVITIIAALCPSCHRPTTEQLHGSGDHRRSPLIQSVASITQQPLYPAPLWAMERSGEGGGQGWGEGHYFPFTASVWRGRKSSGWQRSHKEQRNRWGCFTKQLARSSPPAMATAQTYIIGLEQIKIKILQKGN